MKTIYTVISMLFIATLAQAQIPNASFENWSNGSPVGWTVVNSPDTLVVQSSNAKDGNYAVRLNVSSISGITFAGYLFSGDSGTDGAFPIATLPGALNGWYIGHPDPIDTGDMLAINSYTNGGILLGVGITEASSVYKQFSFNYLSDTGTGPDSAFIEFSLSNFTTGTLSTATYFIIDDLSFGPAVTGITPVNDEAVLEQCVPNPASTTANIIYSITGNSLVNLGLYDVLGRPIKTLLDNTDQTPGRYKIPTDVSALPNGVYLYRLIVNGQSYTQKLVVSK